MGLTIESTWVSEPNNSSISLVSSSCEESTTESSDKSSIFLTISLAWTINWMNSSPLKASQNSSCALPCNNFLILSTSLAPGSSNRILAELPILWITGDKSPSGSTLFLKTCNADSML